jgi:hypothetical protein
VLSLQELASNLLVPVEEEHFSLPAITNFRAIVQCAWDVTGIQNFICAPAGMNTPTALLFVRDGGRWRRFARAGTCYRWCAYELTRQGGGVRSVTRLTADSGAVMQRIETERSLQAALVFGGLPRVWRFTDYWNLPPEDVPQMNLTATGRGFRLTDTKTFGAAEFVVPGRHSVYSDLCAFLDGDQAVQRGRLGVAEFTLEPGERFEWWGAIGAEVTLPAVRFAADWDAAQRAWEQTWQAAFTPGNREFTGHLPRYEGPLARLYYMSVLSLLMTRRFIPPPTPRSLIATGGQCIWTPPEAHGSGSGDVATVRPASSRLEKAYVWGGPDGAPTTSFLWEVEFQAPLLARLDPVVLRAQLEALMRVDLHKHWGFESISGAGAGMAYGVNPGAFLSCVADYVRFTGDKAWALRHIDYLKSCLRPELTDYGDCQNILECVSTYEHTIAAFNAQAVAGLRFMADLTGDATYRQQADALARQVLALYAGGPWYCVQPDGSKRIVKTILDFVYVGRYMTADLPDDVKRGMVAYFERDLQTEDWLYALSPSDPDALTDRLPDFQKYRADHQATGSYDGWPARAASVLYRFGERERAERWLLKLQELTREGPFGQARFIHPPDSVEGSNPTFPSRTHKASFFNGNCYFESAGCGFATTLLESRE